jgi:hypothetical protein
MAICEQGRMRQNDAPRRYGVKREDSRAGCKCTRLPEREMERHVKERYKEQVCLKQGSPGRSASIPCNHDVVLRLK